MAMIVDALISNLMTLLSDLAKEEVALLRGVPDEIKKLQRTLRRLDKLVASAERKRAVDKLVEDWIRELKDAMYDAQDILDDCQIEAERSSGEAQLQSRRRFSHLFCCFCKAKATHEMGTRISVLNGRLEEIYKARSDLGLAALYLSYEEMGSLYHLKYLITEDPYGVVTIEEIKKTLFL